MKKRHSKLPKKEPENLISHKLRYPNIFVKGFKKSEIDFWYKATVELVKSAFWFWLDLLFMGKGGWCFGLEQEVDALGWGELSEIA